LGAQITGKYGYLRLNTGVCTGKYGRLVLGGLRKSGRFHRFLGVSTVFWAFATVFWALPPFFGRSPPFFRRLLEFTLEKY
jgi:hypothetical protein